MSQSSVAMPKLSQTVQLVGTHETCSFRRLEYCPASEDQTCGRSEKVEPRSAGEPRPRRRTVFWQHPCHRENADTSLKIRRK